MPIQSSRPSHPFPGRPLRGLDPGGGPEEKQGAQPDGGTDRLRGHRGHRRGTPGQPGAHPGGGGGGPLRRGARALRAGHAPDQRAAGAARAPGRAGAPAPAGQGLHGLQAHAGRGGAAGRLHLRAPFLPRRAGVRRHRGRGGLAGGEAGGALHGPGPPGGDGDPGEGPRLRLRVPDPLLGGHGQGPRGPGRQDGGHGPRLLPGGPAGDALVAGAGQERGAAGGAGHPHRRPDALPGRRGDPGLQRGGPAGLEGRPQSGHLRRRHHHPALRLGGRGEHRQHLHPGQRHRLRGPQRGAHPGPGPAPGGVGHHPQGDRGGQDGGAPAGPAAL